MGAPSDWTERHRPSSEQWLEGNEVQRRTIRAWLDEWKHGIPKKKALLLIGPPGVGKTTVARAVAEDMGWTVIELNASDERNAAALRKAATSGAIHRSLFHDPHQVQSRTLILLDEVDHLSGGLREVSQDRIEKAMQEPDDAVLSGDSGGKAELLRLLEQTKQPVVLACNDEMGLWGRTSSWRSARDRFGKHVVKINFERASKEALRRIARRVLRAEDINFEPSAVEALVASNYGDLRALVRDLQVMTSDLAGEPLTKAIVEGHVGASQRDVSVEIFPGLERLYRERSSAVAAELIRTIDKAPEDFLDWVHWNNAALFTHPASVRRATTSLMQADRNFMGRFINLAHRSTYWTQHLTALSASVANSVPLDGRLYVNYPHFLRRSGSTGRTSILEKLSEFCSTSNVATREDFLQPLETLLDAESPLGDPSAFASSLCLGLNAQEHLDLTGLSTTRRSAKELVAAYEAAQLEYDAMAKSPEPTKHEPIQPTSVQKTDVPSAESEGHDREDNGLPPGQATLF
jgi:replication factor C large subunit